MCQCHTSWHFCKGKKSIKMDCVIFERSLIQTLSWCCVLSWHFSRTKLIPPTHPRHAPTTICIYNTVSPDKQNSNIYAHQILPIAKLLFRVFGGLKKIFFLFPYQWIYYVGHAGNADDVVMLWLRSVILYCIPTCRGPGIPMSHASASSNNLNNQAVFLAILVEIWVGFRLPFQGLVMHRGMPAWSEQTSNSCRCFAIPQLELLFWHSVWCWGNFRLGTGSHERCLEANLVKPPFDRGE